MWSPVRPFSRMAQHQAKGRAGGSKTCPGQPRPRVVPTLAATSSLADPRPGGYRAARSIHRNGNPAARDEFHATRCRSRAEVLRRRGAETGHGGAPAPGGPARGIPEPAAR